MPIFARKQHQPPPPPASARLSRPQDAALATPGTVYTSCARSGDIEQPAIPSIVHSTLAAPGQPLAAPTRDIMQRHFGHDFGLVRIHADAQAAESARAVQARAYTVGRDVVFGAGQYAPGTLAGRRLLAHELAHTLQHSNGAGARPVQISDAADPVEHDAARAANDLMAGRAAAVTTTANSGMLYRQPAADATLRPSRRVARLVGQEVLDDFALESYRLTEDHRRRLSILAQTLLDLLRDYPGGSVLITGHADATGGETFNEGLGLRRADAVRAFLLIAGIPDRALVSVSAGESDLRIPTARPEPRNRRAEVRFDPAPKGRLFPSSALRPPGLSGEPEPAVPRPENLCRANPDLCAKEPAPRPPRGAEIASLCTSTNCSAVSGDSFDRQPPDLRRVLAASFKDPATWFARLDSERRMALTSIFNRMCRYGVWCHARLVLKIDPGEAPVEDILLAPGKTPSVIYMSPSGDALLDALMATGRFCQASGIGASQHPGQSTLREISRSDSLHISIGPGDQFDAHIDHHSSVHEHPGSSFCPNAPSAAAVGHIGRELVPEFVRKFTGLPGFQVFPEEPTPSGPVEPEPDDGAPRLSPGGTLIGVTLRGPLSQPRKRREAQVALDLETAARIDRAIQQQVSPDALLPSHMRARRDQARKAADLAGPNEEAALQHVRDLVEQEATNYPDAHVVASELAERMEQARRSRVAWVKLTLPHYDARDFGSRRAIAKQIQRIALIIRNYLPDRAANVQTIVIIFGSANLSTREEVRLP